MKERQSNFELLRLVAMLMVMLCHAVGYVQEQDLVGAAGVGKLAVGQLCLVCVNVFVMISGWFGIRASLKGAAKLLFQVVFLALLCFGVFAALGLPVSFRKDLLPYLLFGYGYWFVVSYLILYALSPVLNAFVERASKKEFGGVLIAFFAAEFVFGFLLDAGHFDYGFSPLFFIGLYLLARYVRMHPGKLSSFRKGTDLAIYLGASLLSMVLFWFGYKWFGMGFHLNHYDSPLTVVAALYLLLFFSKLSFRSKTVNWLAVSAFAIYLLHENSLVAPFYHHLFEHLHDSVCPTALYPAMLGIVIALALAFILIDKLRLLAWDALKGRFFPDRI
ncbi:MAG: acyltransferase family protein [Bacteroidales bacterium]|nr:acyltransferase family protein [Bacteroidales bacterium]